MKRIITICGALCMCCVISTARLEPEPVEIKPVLVRDAKQWELTKAYYQRVALPDGSRLELKSKTPLTKEQWQALADRQWKARQEEPEPEMCPHCGGTGQI